MIVWLRRVGALLLVLVAAVAVFVGVAWWRSNAAMAHAYSISDAPLPMAAADVARGEYLFETRGCADCHGADGRGTLVMDAGPVAQVHAANITPAGLRGRYDASRLAAAIRHGVRADGTSLIFMPSMDWSELSDRDTADLTAYVLQLPSVAVSHPASRLGPLGRILWFTGKAGGLLPATVIDHSPRLRPEVAIAANAEYGEYLVAMCRSCHGPQLAGGVDLGPGEPKSANINMARGGLAGWTRDDFLHAMHTGIRPDGRKLADIMPWRAVAAMKPVEQDAIWAYLSRSRNTGAAE